MASEDSLLLPGGNLSKPAGSVVQGQYSPVQKETLTREKIDSQSVSKSASDGGTDRRGSMVTASSGYETQKEEQSQPGRENSRESRARYLQLFSSQETTMETPEILLNMEKVSPIRSNNGDQEERVFRDVDTESRNTNTVNADYMDIIEPANDEGQTNGHNEETLRQSPYIVNTGGNLQNSTCAENITLDVKTNSPTERSLTNETIVAITNEDNTTETGVAIGSTHDDAATETNVRTANDPDNDKTVARSNEIARNDAAVSDSHVYKPSTAERKVRFQEVEQKSDFSGTSDGFCLSPGAIKLKQELQRMQERDDKLHQQQRVSKKKEVMRLKAKLTKARQHQSIGFDMDADVYKQFISAHLQEEEVLALKAQQDQRDEETRQIARDIDVKHGIAERKNRGNVRDILKERDSKRGKRPTSASELIRRELTHEEIHDLHVAFDMFDINEKGLITASDLRRLGSMLRFPMENTVLRGMIAKLDRSRKGGVSFEDFLQFVMTGQDDGPDPYEDIIQGFDMIDVDRKGYITFEDVRQAADGTDAVFSNTMIREMITEADGTGDGKITRREFVRIMLETNRFRAVKKSLHL